MDFFSRCGYSTRNCTGKNEAKFRNTSVSSEVIEIKCFQFVDKVEAESLKLFSVLNGSIKLRAESQTKVPVSSGPGRKSVQIESVEAFNEGLFIISIKHIPAGPGVWPAIWLIGPDWPNNGEIDIVEGFNSRQFNTVTMRTGRNCSMKDVSER